MRRIEHKKTFLSSLIIIFGTHLSAQSKNLLHCSQCYFYILQKVHRRHASLLFFKLNTLCLQATREGERCRAYCPPPPHPLITSVEKQVKEKQGGSFTGFFSLIYERQLKLTGKENCRNGISVHSASFSYRTQLRVHCRYMYIIFCQERKSVYLTSVKKMYLYGPNVVLLRI